MMKHRRRYKYGYNFWSLRHFLCRCALRHGSRFKLLLMPWPRPPWRVWAVQPSSQMVHQSGSSSAFLWPKHRHYGHGWVMICRSTLQHGSSLQSLRCLSAFKLTFLEPVDLWRANKPRIIAQQMRLPPKVSP